MPLIMRVHSAGLLQCRFAVSPLTETTDALRSLVRPAPEAYHLTWQGQVRPRLPGLPPTPSVLPPCSIDPLPTVLPIEMNTSPGVPSSYRPTVI